MLRLFALPRENFQGVARIVDVDHPGVGVDMDLHQALATLLGDHVDAGPDVLDSLRILETAQGDASQQFAVQRQLEEMRVLVGHADQAAPAGVEGQRRDVGLRAQHAGFDIDPIVGQAQGVLARNIAAVALPQLEPDALERALLLTRHQQRKQRGEQASQQRPVGHQPTHRYDSSEKHSVRRSRTEPSVPFHEAPIKYF